MPDQKKSAELIPQSSPAPVAYTAAADRPALRRRILGASPSEGLIQNAKRVLTVLTVTDAAGNNVQGEPTKGAFVIALTRKSDGRSMAELLDLCHALWPEATFSAKDA